MKTLCSFLFRIFQNFLRIARIQFLSSFVYQECTGLSPCSIPFVNFKLFLEEDSYNIIPSDYYHKNHHNGYTC